MFSRKSNLLPVTWAEARPKLENALGEHCAHVESEINAGNENVFRIENTYMLLRSERLKNGDLELVVVGLAGDMAAGTMAAIQHAQYLKHDSIRAHFKKRGACRFIARKLGLPVREIETKPNEHILQIRFLDMGGKSSSSSSSQTITQTTNVSGSAAASGDNLGVMISGVNESDINLTVTDHGALKVASGMADEAFHLSGLALKANEGAVKDSLEASTKTFNRAFEFGEDALTNSLKASAATVDKAFDFSNGTLENALAFGAASMEESTANSQHAIDTIKAIASQQTETTKSAIALADGAKAREQTGDTESNNDLLKNVSLMVGIVGTFITLAYLMRGSK
ncbi:hypothetical protein [Enterovibrio calviensis]|uniref:hypothetical protein n=1 Tax=Enterovibrio calviensis TaxID=91359 RepID=UPI00048331F5|nr:hypothetical protein [Enterovibrio calviensis]